MQLLETDRGTFTYLHWVLAAQLRLHHDHVASSVVRTKCPGSSTFRHRVFLEKRHRTDRVRSITVLVLDVLFTLVRLAFDIMLPCSYHNQRGVHNQPLHQEQLL